MKDRIKIIFRPYLIALVLFLCGYTFLNWLLINYLEVFSFPENVVNTFLPMILGGLIAVFFIRPRFKALNLKTKKGSWKDFYTFISAITIIIPAIIAQHYIITATGKLTQLQSINEINKAAPTKYYRLNNFYFDSANKSVRKYISVSGKGNRNYNMDIYIVVPILRSIRDTTIVKPHAWLGFNYHKQISNRLSYEEKQSIFQEFYVNSLKYLSYRNLSSFNYFDRIGNNTDRDQYRIATRKNDQYEGSYTILTGVNEPFSARNGNKLFWIILSSLIGSIVILTLIAIPKTDSVQLNRIIEGKPDREAMNDILPALNFLKPKNHFFVTPILIYLNLFVFILMVMYGLGMNSVASGNLIYWGANFGPYSRNGELWRLLWSTFLNNGILQLVVNSVGLFSAGLFLEKFLGRNKFIMVYILCAIGSGLLSMWWNEDAISVGASGTIIGLYGVLLALIYEQYYRPEISAKIIISLTIFLIYNFIALMIGAADNAAHVGGLITGFISGILILPWMKPESQNAEL